MAYVYKRGDKWYIGFRDNRGRWKAKACSARSKTEAKRLADELGFNHERQRLGLEPLPGLRRRRYFRRAASVVAEDVLDEVGVARPEPVDAREALPRRGHSQLRLQEVTPPIVEVFLEEKAECLAPQTLNHLRRFVLTAFNRARRAGRWTGPNPAAEVSARRVPKRKADFLRAEEVGAGSGGDPARAGDR